MAESDEDADLEGSRVPRSESPVEEIRELVAATP